MGYGGFATTDGAQAPMLKNLSLLCDIVMAVAFGFALWTLSMVYAQAVDPKYWFFPPVYVQASQGILAPCVHAVEAQLGSQLSAFGEHQIQVSYGVLGCIGIAFGVAFLWVSSLVTALSQKVKAVAQSLKEQHYTQRAKKEKVITQSRSLHSNAEKGEEYCALLGIHFDNLEPYPQLQRALQIKLDGFSPNTLLFEGENRLLLKLRSTMAAVEMIQDFREFYAQASRSARLQVGNVPAMRFVIHSVATANHVLEEDGLVQSLLNCAGANQVFLSPAAKDQYTVQNTRRTTPYQFQLQLLGTFSVQNHPLERVDVYKLSQ